MTTEFKQNSILNALLSSAKTNPKLLNTLSPDDQQAVEEYRKAKIEAQSANMKNATVEGALTSHTVTKRSELKSNKECSAFISEYGISAYLALEK